VAAGVVIIDGGLLNAGGDNERTVTPTNAPIVAAVPSESLTLPPTASPTNIPTPTAARMPLKALAALEDAAEFDLTPTQVPRATVSPRLTMLLTPKPAPTQVLLLPPKPTPTLTRVPSEFESFAALRPTQTRPLRATMTPTPTRDEGDGTIVWRHTTPTRRRTQSPTATPATFLAWWETLLSSPTPRPLTPTRTRAPTPTATPVSGTLWTWGID